jgi:hypothetical protein
MNSPLPKRRRVFIDLAARLIADLPTAHLTDCLAA